MNWHTDICGFEVVKAIAETGSKVWQGLGILTALLVWALGLHLVQELLVNLHKATSPSAAVGVFPGAYLT